MRPTHVILLLLILAHLLLVLCFRLTLDEDWYYTKSRPGIGWLDALVIAQVSLVAIWAAIGRTSILIRLPGAMVLICGLAAIVLVPFQLVSLSLIFWANLISFIAQAAIIIVSLFTLRVCGFQLFEPSPKGSEVSERAGRRWQFSVAQVLVLTGEIAILAAVALRIGKPEIEWELVWHMTKVMLQFAIPVPLLVWAILSPCNLGPRIGVATAATAVVIAFWPIYWTTSHLTWKSTIAQIAVLAVSLVVVRIAGYRFARPTQA
jgi:hypothetical protein